MGFKATQQRFFTELSLFGEYNSGVTVVSIHVLVCLSGKSHVAFTVLEFSGFQTLPILDQVIMVMGIMDACRFFSNI